MKHNPVSVVFDGPAGVGKSTIAKAIAQKLGYAYVDTGAMYRAVTLFALENNIAIDAANQQALLDLALTDKFRFTFVGSTVRIHFGSRDLTEAIRSLKVTRNVSYIAALPLIRMGLRNIQRELAASSNVVMEGRDIGTAVLPNASYKFFLTARTEVRAQRRFLEFKDKGISIAVEEIQRDIEVRDKLDSTRAHSPLLKADDAIEIDTSDLSTDEVIDLILSYIN